MRALDLKLWRDLWAIRGQAVAIALVVTAGMTVLVMSLGAIVSLEETRLAYYERYRFADVFASAKRAPERLKERIADIPGVQTVETRVVRYVTLDIPGFAEPAMARLVSVPEDRRPLLNDLALRAGRWVERGRPDEAIVSETLATGHGLVLGGRIGAVVNGRLRQLEIVGIALSPEFVYSIGPGALMPDDRRYGVVWMGREALAAAFDLDGAFNDLSLSLLRGAGETAAIEELDRLLEPYGGTGAYARKDQISNWFVSGEIDQLKSIATILPTIFLAVAAFLLNIVISRLIALERGQIGLMKAFGYSDLAVGWHYMKLVLVIALGGVALGVLGGIGMGRWITQIYTLQFKFPLLYYRLDTEAILTAVAVSLAAAALGAWAAVRRAAALPPAEAMRPPPPPIFRGGALAAWSLPAWIDQPTRMIVRHILRSPVRSLSSLAGIALSVSLLVVSLNWRDAIAELIDSYFHETQRQDITLGFAEDEAARARFDAGGLPGVLAAEPFRSISAKLRHGQRERREGVVGVLPEASLRVIHDASGKVLQVAPSGLTISTKLAELLGVEPGDEIEVEALTGRRTKALVPVVATFETYIGSPAYMHLDALNRLMGEGAVISGVELRVDPAEQDRLYARLKRTAAVAAVMSRKAAIDMFSETLEKTIDIMIGFYVIFGCVTAFGVVYNAARIGLSERERELASLRVLGFTRFEISYILIGELVLIALAAMPIGCLVGYGLSLAFKTAFDNDLYRIPIVAEPATYGLAMAFAGLAVAVACWSVRRRIDQLDLVAVLKTRE